MTKKIDYRFFLLHLMVIVFLILFSLPKELISDYDWFKGFYDLVKIYNFWFFVAIMYMFFMINVNELILDRSEYLRKRIAYPVITFLSIIALNYYNNSKLDEIIIRIIPLMIVLFLLFPAEKFFNYLKRYDVQKLINKEKKKFYTIFFIVYTFLWFLIGNILFFPFVTSSLISFSLYLIFLKFHLVKEYIKKILIPFFICSIPLNLFFYFTKGSFYRPIQRILLFTSLFFIIEFLINILLYKRYSKYWS